MKPRRPLFPPPVPPPDLNLPSAARPPILFYFIAATLLLLVVAAAWRTVDDSMLLLHLKTGELILKNYQLPARDLFSAGSFAEFWIFIQWGWAVVLAQAYKLGQWTGLAVLNVICVAAVASLLMLRARRYGAAWFESLVTTAATLGLLIPSFQPNATSAVLPLWLISLLLCESRRLRPMACLPFVTIAWANLHPALLLPALLPLARLAFPPPSEDKGPQRSPSTYLFTIIAGCLLAAFITPHSMAIVQGMLTTAAVSFTHTTAHWSTILANPWTLLRLVFVLALFISLVASRRALYGWQIAIACILIASCAISPVALNFLIIFLAAPAARMLSALLATTWQTRVIRPAAASALVLFVCAVSAGTLAISGVRNDAFGTGLRPNVFPEASAGRLASLPLRNSILNDAQQGGYIVWRTWPSWKITADMRPTLYNADFRQNYEKLWEGGRGWSEMLNYWHVWAVLGSPDVMRKYPNSNLYYRLADSSEWIPVLWDSEAILYLKADADLGTSNLQPFRQLKPGLSWPAMAARIKTPEQWRELAADLRRVMMEDRTNAIAREFLQRAEAEVAGR